MSIVPEGLALQLLKIAADPIGQDCTLCGSGSQGPLVCAQCQRRLPYCAPGSAEGLAASMAFDDAFAALEYRFPIDRLIHRFKFAGDLAVGHWLARQLARAVTALPAPGLLVAPPLTGQSLRERGFNQALEIAKVVGRATGARVDFAAMAKVRATRPQLGLGLRERRANLRGAFTCRRTFSGEHVAIVDDVLTTGATADALARALKDAGAGRVSVWAVALAPDPRR
jgi:ComF family protein